jgi:hypothetical protein
MRHLNPNWEFLSMTTGYVYNRPDLVTIGVFMRGVLLGELGFNNLIANGGLSKLAKDLCQGQRGYSLRTYEIGFQQGETHIVDRDTGWDELVKIYESQLLSGEDIRNVLNEFTYVIAFQSITGSDRAQASKMIQCYNSIFQHLAYFSNAISQNAVTQTLQ